jgi:UPF0716 family protein affecting phage T7 exclusion
VRQGGIQGAAQDRRLALALGGILLLLPGFITDLVGAGLLVGPIRRRLVGTIAEAIARRRRTGGPGAVIDLAPDEWHAVPDKPRRKRKQR